MPIQQMFLGASLGGDEYWWTMAKGSPSNSASATGLRIVKNITIDDDGNIYTAWAKWLYGGCVVTKHDKFGAVKWVKQIMVSAKVASGSVQSPTSEQSNTKWCSGIVWSPYNGYIICSVLDVYSWNQVYGDLVHVALSSSDGSEQWARRQDAYDGIRNNWNSTNDTVSGYFRSAESAGHVNNLGGGLIHCPENSSLDYFVDTGVQLGEVKIETYGNHDVGFLLAQKASDGSNIGSSHTGYSSYTLSGSSFAETFQPSNSSSLYWPSGTTGYICIALDGYINWMAGSAASGGNFGGNGSEYWRRLENTFPNSPYTAAHSHKVTHVDSSTIIQAASYQYSGRAAIAVARVVLSSGSNTDASWRTDYSMYLNDINYSQNDSRVYWAGQRDTASSNFDRHAVVGRTQFDASTKSHDWVKDIKVQKAGSTVDARGVSSIEKDGKLYVGIDIIEDPHQGMLMVFDAVNGPTNGTYGDGTSTNDYQIIISDLGAGLTSASASNSDFGNGGTGTQSSRWKGSFNYNANSVDESDDSTYAVITDLPNVKDGTGGSNEGFSGGARKID
tara:strand:- start:2192 stop:3865 length:1674 start_codon:yes stop_codon:yes gene_type:complete